MEQIDTSENFPLNLKTAVLIPCLNEEAAIAQVISGFREVLPGANIYVYDNGSTDRTVEIAHQLNVIVRTESVQGKGNVVCRMFSDIDAEIYVLVDGDGTYDPKSAPRLINQLIGKQLDMVCGARIANTDNAYRLGHRFGNVLLTHLAGKLFNGNLRDMLSGYRVFSRRFVKTFPVQSMGFEIETQFTIHALSMKIPFEEIDTPYKERDANSCSKLKTYQDGWKILRTISYLLKEEKPMVFFTILFFLLAFVSIILAWPILVEFTHTGLVPRFPTLILSTGLMLLAFLSLTSGLILDSVANGRRETKRLYYLGRGERI